MADVRRCVYCTIEIPKAASRCPHCAGEYRNCPKCRMLVAITARQKFVGILRGGMKTQIRCGRCEKVLDGPRF